jgi:hypothetical protein
MDEWMEYYQNVSVCYDNDDYFVAMIKSAWNLDNKTYGKAWAKEY